MQCTGDAKVSEAITAKTVQAKAQNFRIKIKAKAIYFSRWIQKLTLKPQPREKSSQEVLQFNDAPFITIIVAVITTLTLTR